jgi:hypothetical protein
MWVEVGGVPIRRRGLIDCVFSFREEMGRSLLLGWLMIRIEVLGASLIWFLHG